MQNPRFRLYGLIGVVVSLVVTQVAAQQSSQAKPAPRPAARGSVAVAEGVVVPSGYTIGADDLLSIRFWGDTQLSADVVVRPDGKISVPLINDIQAAGLTPEQLGTSLEKAALKFIMEPDATVIVREVRSRKVFVLGQGVAKQGVVILNSDMTVLQALAAAGGLLEYANRNDITILRNENGREKRFKFKFDEVTQGKNIQQNIQLQPNDTILVR